MIRVSHIIRELLDDLEECAHKFIVHMRYKVESISQRARTTTEASKEVTQIHIPKSPALIFCTLDIS